jgi:hypothetical protein
MTAGAVSRANEAQDVVISQIDTTNYALRIYHYGSPEIVESPAAWFQTDGAGTITNYLFEAGREEVVIPWEIDGVAVTAIYDSAFATNYVGYAITSVTGSKSILSIGDFAFHGCDALTTASFPSATSIGDFAFRSCDALTTASFPSATSIAYSAFRRCDALTTASFPSATSIENVAFYGCDALITAEFPSATSLGNGVFSSCILLTNVYLGITPPTFGTDIFADSPTAVFRYPRGADYASTIATYGPGTSYDYTFTPYEPDSEVETGGSSLLNMDDASGLGAEWQEWVIGGAQNSNGNWRVGVVNSNFVIQVRDNGHWMEAVEFGRP